MAGADGEGRGGWCGGADGESELVLGFGCVCGLIPNCGLTLTLLTYCGLSCGLTLSFLPRVWRWPRICGWCCGLNAPIHLCGEDVSDGVTMWSLRRRHAIGATAASSAECGVGWCVHDD